MKAIRVHQFGGPEVLQLEEIPTPQPAPNQILVRVKAIGVNPVETYIRSGLYSKAAGVISNLPYTPGRDAAGIVERIGAEIRDVKIGDRVYVSNTSTGAYAEFCLCGADDVHPLPEKISFAQGAGLSTPYATAWRALFQRAKVILGETVLIHGASGGVGTAATQIARAAGLMFSAPRARNAAKISSRKTARITSSIITRRIICNKPSPSRTDAASTSSSKCSPT